MLIRAHWFGAVLDGVGALVEEAVAVERPAPSRLGGVDAARALAVVGMVVVHFGPRGASAGEGLAAWLVGVPFGKASILFALVAGVGVSLLAERKPDDVRPRLLYRMVWLFPVGLWLQELDHPVAVILQYYAVWFALAALFVRVRDRVLLWWSGVGLAVGSVAYAWVVVNQHRWLQLEPNGDSPGGVLMDILWTGYYPTVTWLPVVLFGMWLGRRDLSSPRTWARLVVGGAVVSAVVYRGGMIAAELLDVQAGDRTWARLLSIRGHSQMPLAVVGSTAFVTVVLGLCLWSVARWPRLTRPLVAFGQGALTVYVGHLAAWHVWPDLFPSSNAADTWTAVGWFALVNAAWLTAWLALFSRAPLEMLVRAPWRYAFQPLVRLARGPGEEASSG